MKSFIVDSFTKEPFKGNPAGVCFPEGGLSDEKMLKIAQEFGLSETAFLSKIAEGKYSIRYFSPRQEIPLCGHATLASAKVIFRKPEIDSTTFITSENLELFVARHGAEIEMEFPVYGLEAAPAPPALLTALGLDAISASMICRKLQILLLEIDSPTLLASLAPDFHSLKESHSSISGVLVTALSEKAEFDFEYRYFWPWSGTDEDPVTGGVQTFLAPYWAEKLGKPAMKAFQCSARSGYMEIELREGKVFLRSDAVVFLEGDLQDF